jgi:hypothetical protein
MTAGSRTNPGSRSASGTINPDRGPGVLRRREPTRFLSASDDEVGGQNARSAAGDVRAADLEEEPTKPVEDKS